MPEPAAAVRRLPFLSQAARSAEPLRAIAAG